MKTLALLLMAVAPAALAQVAVAITSPAGMPGPHTASIVITKSGPIAAAGLQWTLNYGSELSVSFVSQAPLGKTLTCGAPAALGLSTSITCLLVGLNNGTALPDGILADAHIMVPLTDAGNMLPLHLSGVVAVDAQGSNLAVTSTDGTLTIGTPNCAAHTLDKNWAGSLAVYRNSLLVTSAEYSISTEAGTGLPIVSPVGWTFSDKAQAIYTRATPPRNIGTINGVKYTYQTYIQQREEWDCMTGSGGVR